MAESRINDFIGNRGGPLYGVLSAHSCSTTVKDMPTINLTQYPKTIRIVFDTAAGKAGWVNDTTVPTVLQYMDPNQDADTIYRNLIRIASASDDYSGKRTKIGTREVLPGRDYADNIDKSIVNRCPNHRITFESNPTKVENYRFGLWIKNTSTPGHVENTRDPHWSPGQVISLEDLLDYYCSFDNITEITLYLIICRSRDDESDLEEFARMRKNEEQREQDLFEEYGLYEPEKAEEDEDLFTQSEQDRFKNSSELERLRNKMMMPKKRPKVGKISEFRKSQNIKRPIGGRTKRTRKHRKHKTKKRATKHRYKF